MDRKPKARAPARKPKLEDPKQSERFIETALALGIEEAGPNFDSVFARVVRIREPRKKVYCSE